MSWLRNEFGSGSQCGVPGPGASPRTCQGCMSSGPTHTCRTKNSGVGPALCLLMNRSENFHASSSWKTTEQGKRLRRKPLPECGGQHTTVPSPPLGQKPVVRRAAFSCLGRGPSSETVRGSQWRWLVPLENSNVVSAPAPRSSLLRAEVWLSRAPLKIAIFDLEKLSPAAATPPWQP